MHCGCVELESYSIKYGQYSEPVMTHEIKRSKKRVKHPELK